MNETDAQDYRDAAELICNGKHEFSCLALVFDKDDIRPGVNRPDLVKPFLKTFNPRKDGEMEYVFWDENAEDDDPTQTNSAEHSRECRILALLLMAEMIENP